MGTKAPASPSTSRLSLDRHAAGRLRVSSSAVRRPGTGGSVSGAMGLVLLVTRK
jgi:hypothetical protein